MSLGERIKSHRQRCGLSQEKVAEAVGVSRQAVTKWETGQSMPSTENLFRLAALFGTSADLLLDPGEQTPRPQTEPSSGPAAQPPKGKSPLEKAKKNLPPALAVAAGYLVVYLAGRLFGGRGEPASLLGWLWGQDPQQLPYVYGWLLHRNLFWSALAVSAAAALLGKKYFGFTCLLGFAAGLAAGELWGQNPAGAAYGHDHYGWAIWGCVFLFSALMGAVLEKLVKNPGGRRKKLLLWAAVLLAGMAAAVLAVRAGMPSSFS